MRAPVFTTRSRRDLKRQKKRGKSREKVDEIINFIAKTGDAPEECHPHNLTQNWAGYRECHIEEDWILIFKVDDKTVTLYRTGTHSGVPRKTSFASFSRYPAGLVYWGKGL